MAAAWLVAVTVIAALAYLTYLVAMTVEKRLDNLEDDLDDVDNLVKAYHNASCGSFRLTNASCAQIAQYDAVAGVASAASTLDAALNATGLGIDVAQDVSRLTDAAQVLACVETSIATSSSRRRVDGVEVDAKNQHEGAIKFDFHTAPRDRDGKSAKRD